MALPVSLSGLATNANVVGPFKRSNGFSVKNHPATTSLSGFAVFGGATNVDGAQAQSFLVGGSNIIVTNVHAKVGKVGSPTDDLSLEIRSGSQTGTLIATSNTIAGTSLINIGAGGAVGPKVFTFASPPTLTASTTYYLVLKRSGANNTSNYYAVYGNLTGSSTYADGTASSQQAGGSWSNVNSDWFFSVNVASEAYYVIGKSTATSTGLIALKATDPSSSFSSVGSELTAPGSAIVQFLSAYQVGDLVYVLFTAGSNTAVVTALGIFSLTADDWFPTNVSILATAETVQGSVDSSSSAAFGVYGCGVTVRSNGEVVALIQTVRVANMGSSYSRVGYLRRTAEGTWSAATGVDNGGTVDHFNPRVVGLPSSNNRVHLAWYSNGSGAIRDRTLSAANSLSTLISTPGSANLYAQGVADFEALVLYDAAGTGKYVGVAKVSATATFAAGRFNSADAPSAISESAAISSNVDGAPLRVFVDGTDVYAVYRSTADSDLKVSKSTDHGATWGTAVSLFVGTVSAALHANLSDNQKLVYQRGQGIVWGYVVNDNGTLKYNEYVVRTLGPAPMPAAVGAFNLTGQAVTTRYARAAMPAAYGNFSLGGQAATLTKIAYGPVVADHLPVADQPVASYAVAGSRLADPALAPGGSMPAAVGIFTLSGGAAGRKLEIAADHGTYNLVGQPVTKRQTITASLGTYSLVGGVAGRKLEVAVGHGIFSLVGQTVTKRQTITALFGNYTLVGQTVTKRQTVTASFGTFNLVGQTVGRRITAAMAHGLYNLSGQVVVLAPPGLRLSAFFGAYNLVGQTVGRRQTFAASYGLYNLAGQAVPLDAGNPVLAAGPGTFSLVGQTVELVPPAAAPDYSLDASTGYFYIVGAGGVVVYALNAARGIFTLAGQPVAIYPGEPRLAAEVGIFSLSGAAFFHYGAAVPDHLAVADAPVASFPVAGSELTTGAAVEHLSVADASVASFPVAGGQLVEPLAGQAYPMPAAAGVFVLVGQPISRHLSIAVSTGFFSYQGAVSITERALIVGLGNFSLAGQAVQFIPAPGSTPMPVGVGTFNLVGQAVGRRIEVAVGHGTYTLVGQAVTKRQTITASFGDFQLAGQQVQFIPAPGGHPMLVGYGAFQLLGQPVAIRGLMALPSAGGTFSLTGFATALFATRRMAAGLGTFNLLGQAVSKRQTFAASRGLFTLSGQAVSRRQTFAATYGSFGLQGKAVSKRQTFAALRGIFNLSGQVVATRVPVRRLVVGHGAYNLIGYQIVLPGSIAAMVGTFQLSGKAVTLAEKHKMPVAFGAFPLGGQTVSTRRRWTLTAQFGAYSLVGQVVVTWRHKKAAAAPGIYQLNGRAVRLARLNILKATAGLGAYNLVGQVVGSLRYRALAVGRGNFSLAGQAVKLQPNLISDVMEAEVGVFALAGQTVGLQRPSLNLSVAYGGYTLTGCAIELTTRGPREPTQPRTGGAAPISTGERHGSRANNISRRRAA